MKPTIRKANEKEFLKVHKFVSHCKPLEDYPEHLYKIILRYFGETCFVAEENNNLIGFVMGFTSQFYENTYFLWQIGVKLSMRGKGMGKMLLQEVEREVKKLRCERIELTIDPENRPSLKLFEKMGYKNISSNEGEIVKVNGKIAVKDYYCPGRHFILYEKKL